MQRTCGMMSLVDEGYSNDALDGLLDELEQHFMILNQADSGDGDVGNDTLMTSQQQYTNTTECARNVAALADWIYLYGFAILLPVAVLLNGLQCAVFVAGALRRYAFSMFLVAAAIFDLLALLSHVPARWMSLVYDVCGRDAFSTLYNTNVVACRAITYVNHATRFASSWTVVALAVERSIVSKDPYRKSLLRRPGTAYKQILMILGTSLVLTCHVVFTWNLVPRNDVAECALDVSSQELSTFLTVVNLILVVAMPNFLTCILTVMIAQNLHGKIWKVRPRNLSKQIIAKILLERQAGVMVAFITGVYALLSLPYTVSWLMLLAQRFTHAADKAVASSSSCAHARTLAATDISETLYMVNYAVKFAFCLFCGLDVVGHK